MEQPAGLNVMTVQAIAQHEMYTAFRAAGFTRPEALYLISQPVVELLRLEWAAARTDGGNP